MPPNSGTYEQIVKEERRDTSKGYKTYFGLEFGQPLIPFNTVLIILFHVIYIYACCVYPFIRCWRTTLFGLVLGILGGFGVTGGVHRHYTHRSFKARLPLQIILLILYASAGHNKLYDWVRDHRVHHKFSETDADPHNSRRGFFFAHVGWLMMKKHPDVITKGKLIDMSDISNDPLLVWFDKHFGKIKFFLCFVLPTIIPVVCWGESWKNSILAQCFLKYVTLLNLTWLVNSAAHLYGNKPYDKNINPRDNWYVSFFAAGLGEGWHNYHHTFPWDYRASEYGKANLSMHLINFFRKIGLAYDCKTASDDLIERVSTKLGDGSHAEYSAIVEEDGDIQWFKEE